MNHPSSDARRPNFDRFALGFSCSPPAGEPAPVAPRQQQSGRVLAVEP
jgi:hypothetical protein